MQVQPTDVRGNRGLHSCKTRYLVAKEKPAIQNLKNSGELEARRSQVPGQPGPPSETLSQITKTFETTTGLKEFNTMI